MKKVFVIGSLNMDLVVHTDTFPRSGETVLGDSFFSNSGGKGANQAVASAKQGAQTFHMGAVGGDLFGQQLIDSLITYGVHCELIKTKECPTGIAMIILHNHDNRIIVSPGANYAYSLEEAKQDLLEHAKPGDIVVFQLEIEKVIVEILIPFAKSLGLFVIFNPAPMIANIDPLLFKSVDLLIMNEWEAKTLTNLDQEPTKLQAIFEKLVTLGANDVIITLGERGGVFLYKGRISEYNPFVTKVVDTTGAGDAFVGTIAAYLTKNMALPEAIKRASYVAALTVSRPGAQQAIPYKEEVDKMFKDEKEIHAR
ncbi:MAG: ribokinase [Bacilli bacterium]